MIGKDGILMNISVDQKAPVFSSAEITIESTIDVVWETLTEITKWASWQSSVTEVNVKDPVDEGTEFTWKADGISFKSRIHTMQPKAKFGWTGRAIGVLAIHNWQFTEKENAIIVYVEESLQGILPTLLRTYFQKNLKKGMLKNLAELKAASELKRKV